MQYIDIQGTTVPRLGFGTWQIQGEDCYAAVRDALDLGYRHIDTAQAYENEDRVGEAIADSRVARQDIFLTTKVWKDRLAYDDVISSTETSLGKLQTDYVDLLLIHWPVDDVPLEETLGAMSELRKQGKARHIGVSNFTPGLVRDALEITPIACNQVEYHPYLDQSKLVDQAAEHGMMLTAYSPLARGRVLGDEDLLDIGARYGKSAAQVALRWSIQQEPVVAIPKAASAEHRRSNLKIFDFELTDEEMRRIDAKRRDDRIINPSWAPRAW
jgi:2,5-diketo-D-gluconate reductase B